MCVIVYKPRGVKKVPKRILKKCWNNNNDGAGYAIWDYDEQQWAVKKGFMFFSKFWNSYREENISTDDTVIVHFRIGTSGKEIPALTHPFPVTDKLEEMAELEYKADNIVFHNGVIGFGENGWSDTCVAVKEIIDPLHPYLVDDKIFNYLQDPLEVKQNRWIITKGAEIYQYGKWETDEGVEYSNDTYKRDRWVGTTHTYDQSYDQFGFPTWPTSQTFMDEKTGKFDWDKWEARGSKQSELPWSGSVSDVPPGKDDEAIIIDMDAEGKGTPEAVFNKSKAADLLCCPNCYHEQYLDDSPFNVGDTICLICGCVFIELTGETCTFDSDIHDKWNKKRKEAGNELG
jgi:hypothetical protein